VISHHKVSYLAYNLFPNLDRKTGDFSNHSLIKQIFRQCIIGKISSL